ncbi:hypothetical protein CC86DRAFT_80179 [Ophiobolus disseminans]|uniref:Uncharacterized protein n=1 Tax=Ophiobolus disseminans TaxID=1469910 RepID=A0A6A6ZQH2_9PLEO|nr:hypothetical protein CC86DRAFT_80179 [Ophiobolus disseminans]
MLSSMTLETLQDIQIELSIHQAMMLNIQSRISQLEQRLAVNAARATHPGTPGPQGSEQHSSKYPAYQTRTWQATRENSMHTRSDTLVDANFFLQKPERVPDFSIDFNNIVERLKAPHVAPDIDDIPELTPTSGRAAHSDAEDFGSREARPSYSIFPPSTKHDLMTEIQRTWANLVIQPQGYCAKSEASVLLEAVHKDGALAHTQNIILNRRAGREDDIIERVVEVESKSHLKPPLLLSPPRSRRLPSSTGSLGSEITALPPMPPRTASPRINEIHSRRFKKRVGVWLSSKVFLKRSARVQHN